MALPDPLEIPLFNTLILLLSGITVTYTHHKIRKGSLIRARKGYTYTFVLALTFMLAQALEFSVTPFNISDSVCGATFFMITGFHGAHVIAGAFLLFISFCRLKEHHFFQQHHFHVVAAIWYWHFVDVVWLIVVLSIYYWGGYGPFQGELISISSGKEVCVECEAALHAPFPAPPPFPIQ
jgi:cytochrome c oxidase subunit 3